MTQHRCLFLLIFGLSAVLLAQPWQYGYGTYRGVYTSEFPEFCSVRDNTKGTPPIAPIAMSATNIYSTGFTASWNSVEGATGYEIDVYSGTLTNLITAGFESSTNFPSGWNSSSVQISTSSIYAHTGSRYVNMNNQGGYFYTPLLSCPTTISFWVRAIASNSVSTLKVQYSSNAVSWYDLASYYTANPDAGSVTTVWTQKTISASLSGNYYVRWFMSQRTTGGQYIDDILISSGSLSYAYSSHDTGNVDQLGIIGLISATDYQYVVRAYNEFGISANSNLISLTTGIYDFPEAVPVIFDGNTVTMTTGNADIGSGDIPDFSNPSFSPSSSFIIALLGSGPWVINISTSSPWGAYFRNNQWHAVQNEGGMINLQIESTKDLDMPIVLGDNDPTLPIELSSFTAEIDAYGKIQLNWVTQSETNAYGFYVLRATENQIGIAQIVSSLIGATNTSTQQLYQFTDESVDQEGVYYYWLQSYDLDGSSSYHGPVTCLFDLDSEPQTPDIPIHHGIIGVYPNPFNPQTTISYGISEPGRVELLIYNLKGQKVRHYTNSPYQPGDHTQVWDGLDSKGNICSSGIYNIVMSEGGRRYYRKVVLSK